MAISIIATKHAPAFTGYRSPSGSASTRDRREHDDHDPAERWRRRSREGASPGRSSRVPDHGSSRRDDLRDATHARAFWIAAPGRGEIRAEPLPPPSADDVVVRALYSGISRGTEALVFQGRVPASEYERMRAPFQAGEFPAPVKYGYASVGGSSAARATCRAATSSCSIRTRRATSCPARSVHVLPGRVPPQRAVLAANLETAINGLWDARPHDRRSHRGRRRRHGRLPGRVAGGPHCRLRRRAGRRQPARGRPIARALGVRFAAPETRRAKRGRRDSRERIAGRTRARAARRRVRGDDRRAELVRRSGGAASLWAKRFTRGG